MHVHKYHFTQSSQEAYSFCSVSVPQVGNVRLAVTCLSSTRDAISVPHRAWCEQRFTLPAQPCRHGSAVPWKRCMACVFSRMQCCSTLVLLLMLEVWSKLASLDHSPRPSYTQSCTLREVSRTRGQRDPPPPIWLLFRRIFTPVLFEALS